MKKCTGHTANIHISDGQTITVWIYIPVILDPKFFLSFCLILFIVQLSCTAPSHYSDKMSDYIKF